MDRFDGADNRPVGNRDELYRNWLDWVTTNLGRDHQLAGVAATAAADAAALGKGFNVAAKAATAAWHPRDFIIAEALLVGGARVIRELNLQGPS
jgi:hypothetical protein